MRATPIYSLLYWLVGMPALVLCEIGGALVLSDYLDREWSIVVSAVIVLMIFFPTDRAFDRRFRKLRPIGEDQVQ